MSKLANYIENEHTILIEGPTGTGKTSLAIDIAVEKAKTGKKVFYITISRTEHLKEHMINLFPEAENLLGKNIFLGQIEPRNEEEFIEDVEYVIKNFSPDVLIIDPIYPDIDLYIFKDLCDLLKDMEKEIIFCSYLNRDLHPLVDVVIEIVGDKNKKEIVVKRKRGEEKTFNFSIKDGKIFVE